MTPKITWPPQYAPEANPIHAVNMLDIQATPEQVWSALVEVTTWPEWYFNASGIKNLGDTGNELVQGSHFKWKTFGVTVISEVVEFKPYERLAWTARALGVMAYHAWLITPTANGCHVLTEETQSGWFCRLGNIILPRRMVDYHQKWLEGLAKRAQGV